MYFINSIEISNEPIYDVWHAGGGPYTYRNVPTIKLLTSTETEEWYTSPWVIVLTITGTALPAGYSLDSVKLHEVVAAEKANDKRKATVKAENKRAAAFARLGF